VDEHECCRRLRDLPLVKTIGLADVVGALPRALATIACARSFPVIRRALARYRNQTSTLPDAGGAYLLAAAQRNSIVLDTRRTCTPAPAIPMSGRRREWPDNAFRFAALSRAAADIGRGAGVPPDVVHAHDWQAGWPACCTTATARVRPVMTVHNLAFQGSFRVTCDDVGLPWHAWSIDGVEFYGEIGYLKAGLQLADRITTVSPTYAAEIRTPEGGMALDGLLRHRAHVLTGILNGIDDAVWNRPPMLAFLHASAPPAAATRRIAEAPYAAQPRRGTRGAAVRPRQPSRGRKGSISFAAVPAIVNGGGQLAVLGTGDPGSKARSWAPHETHPGQVATRIAHDEALAHL
jgi:starch synthase